MSTALSELNQLLSAHPARDRECGDKVTQVARDGDAIVASVTFSGCERQYRFEVPRAALDVGAVGTDVVPAHGRGQVFVPCRSGAAPVRWTIRDDASASWRHVRDDPELALDLAPDQAAADRIAALFAQWLA